MGKNDKKNNHLYPLLHISKWENKGGKAYSKAGGGIIRKINDRDFAKKLYYSLGENNSELEDRLADFESYIGEIIKRIDGAEGEVELTGKELEILKLYCYLCGSRHEFTTEVIKSDESGIYQSNNYLYGVVRTVTQEEAVAVTRSIVEDFEKIKKMKNDTESQISTGVGDLSLVHSTFTTGLHLAIARAGRPMIFVSDRICIIENTMDSDFLYSYVPISPTTALFLVKTKYYLDRETFEYTKYRFGEEKGHGYPDPYLSAVLGPDYSKGAEVALLCSYYKVRSQETYVPRKTLRRAKVKIHILPDFVFAQYNSIFCEDGKVILFCDEEELNRDMNIHLNCREIVYSMPF